MSAGRRRLGELRASIPEITPRAALALQREGAALVDVREPDEVTAGSPAGCIRIARGFLELRIEDAVPDLAAPVVVLCASGVRSLFAAESLRQLGYGDVSSVEGGFKAWEKAGLPVEAVRVLDGSERERYRRHLAIPEVGEEGQARLLESRVLLVGAGGLGSPAAYYLAAAGVGTLGLVDDDVVDRSNLQRQILHRDADVGRPKVESARDALAALNPALRIDAHPVRLTAANADAIVPRYDVIVDGADNFPTRYLVNDACVKHARPNVHGSVYRFEGQVGVFWPSRPDAPGPCYRCLYPEPPPAEMAPSCADAGVLGVLPGVVGLLQAVEVIKIVVGIGEPLVGRLLQYDALEPRIDLLTVGRDPACRGCGGEPNAGEYVTYEQACAAPAGP